MPKRLLIPAGWLARHIREHPQRLAATAVAVLLASLGLLGFSLYHNFDSAREQRMATCREVNELRRQIYVAAIDLGADPVVASRFLPTRRC